MQLTLSPSFDVVGRRAPRGSAYYDPIGVATQCVLAGQPLPVDLQADLDAMGINIEEFTESHQAPESVGFQIEG